MDVFLFDVQEIKFEPTVMCEPINKKFTFRASQVCALHFGLQGFGMACQFSDLFSS